MRLKSFLQYFGSKSRLTKILKLFLPLDMNRINSVVSPFFGSGAFEYYIIEHYPHIKLKGYDIESTLVNYHRCMIDDPKRLYLKIKEMIDHVLSKEEFTQYKDELKASTITEQNRFYFAAILYGLSRNSYSGKMMSYAKKNKVTSIESMRDYSFNSPDSRYGHIDLSVNNCFSVLEDKSLRDNPKTLIYLDPPYYIDRKPLLNHYGITSAQKTFDHHRLFECLKKIKTKWILSYNHSNYIIHLYSGYNIYMKDTHYLRYSPDKTYSDTFTEVIITNYSR